MTNQIASEVLKASSIQQMGFCKVIVDGKPFNVKEALDTAIKVLEQGQKDILRKGEWFRMSDLSEKEDDRYKCSRCGNVVHYENKINLYTFNRWCGRCGSDNGRKIEVEL